MFSFFPLKVPGSNPRTPQFFSPLRSQVRFPGPPNFFYFPCIYCLYFSSLLIPFSFFLFPSFTVIFPYTWEKLGKY